MTLSSLQNLFHLDSLAAIMLGLVSFIGLIVLRFASRYFQGDRERIKFLILLAFLIAVVLVMVSADQLLLFWGAWVASDLLLVRLMIYKPQWRAARAAGYLTARVLFLGWVCLGGAFLLLYVQTQETSIQALLPVLNQANPSIKLALGLLVVTAIAQAGVWPLQRWLLSSLNSPTPVSAIMHAGLVNGGAVLLARFAPAYFQAPEILTIIFVIGAISAVMGTFWKLLQTDVKRMLACSTMAQMGFMLAQCGLGLFPAAVSHLCWHGLFKANLFLGANGVGQSRPVAVPDKVSAATLVFALGCGAVGSYVFALVSRQPWFAANTTALLVLFAFIAAAQFALTLKQSWGWRQCAWVVGLTLLVMASYGLTLRLVELALLPDQPMRPQPLQVIHLIVAALFVLLWLARINKNYLLQLTILARLWPKWYVWALNASQPHPATITAQRNAYRYE